MAQNLSPMPSSMTSSYISNSIALRNRIVVSTCGVDTKFKSKTIPCQKDRPCAREVCMASWLRCPNSRAGGENGRPTTSHLWAAWSLSCRTVRPLLTSRKFRVLQAALWIVTKDYPARSICRVVKMDTSLFGTSRLRQVGDCAGNASQSSGSILGTACFSALRFPLQRKHREAARSKHVKSYSKWHARLAKPGRPQPRFRHQSGLCAEKTYKVSACDYSNQLSRS